MKITTIALLLFMAVNVTTEALNPLFCGADPSVSMSAGIASDDTFQVPGGPTESASGEVLAASVEGLVAEAKAAPGNTGGRVKSGLVALYEFREGSGDTISDSSGLSPELPLMIQNNDRKEVSWAEGGPGISLRASNYQVNMGNMQAQVVSVSPASKISEAIRASSAFTAEVWVRPINAEQTGPVRIATISGGAGSRNLSMGQSGVSWDFRARNPAQAPHGRQVNGLPSMRTLPDAFQVQARVQHIVLTYTASEGGIIYVDGVPRAWELLEGEIVGNAGKWSGELEGWESDFKLMLGNEIGFA